MGECWKHTHRSLTVLFATFEVNSMAPGSPTHGLKEIASCRERDSERERVSSVVQKCPDRDRTVTERRVSVLLYRPCSLIALNWLQDCEALCRHDRYLLCSCRRVV